jgi:Lar family restriction alleviation protein
MGELKPCPFCGASAEITTEPIGMNGQIYFVQCDCCTAQVSEYNSRELAVSYWNRRPAPTGSDGEDEREG